MTYLLRFVGLLTAFLLVCLPALATNFDTASHTTHSRYDDARRLVGTIGADPDGTGALGRPATRNTYDAKGRLVKVEAGELSAWQAADILPENWAGFTVYSVSETEYDEWGRPVKEFVLDGTLRKIATQTSYDGFGRPVCVAQRLNESAFSSMPADACALGTPGSFGPDRITRTNYDEFSRVTSIEKAVGTPLQQAYQTYTYEPYHAVKNVTDAKGNVTEYQYDSFRRPMKTIFPSKTNPGTADATDYEEYTYDDNHNRKTLRKRDGQIISYDYDELNRVKRKDVPGSTNDDDVIYSYDLRSLQLTAQFDTATPEGIVNEFDGFGRLKKTTNQHLSQDLEYGYDDNGNRLLIEYPDGQKITYTRDGLDRITELKINNVQTLVKGEYAARGHLEKTTRSAGAGATTFVNVDGIGRLDTFAHEFSNDQNDLLASFAYNPASQVTSRVFSNSLFDHTNTDFAETGSYTSNGLNQYTEVNGQTLTYDDNGNLTSDGARAYAYDVENRLTTISNGASATLKYDPLGRLYETMINGTTTRFLYDGDALVAEYDDNNQLQRRYVHGSGIDAPLVWFEGSGSCADGSSNCADAMTAANAKYYHADHQGSIIAISDNTGAMTASTSYSPFGVPSSEIEGRFTYTGQIVLPGLDLYHYKARVYSPTLGRFLQTDPIGYADQQNMYAYVANDPLNATDPTGMLTDGNRKQQRNSESHFDRQNPGYEKEVWVYRNGKRFRRIDRAKLDPVTGTLKGVEIKAHRAPKQRKRTDRQVRRAKEGFFKRFLRGVNPAHTKSHTQAARDFRMMGESEGLEHWAYDSDATYTIPRFGGAEIKRVELEWRVYEMSKSAQVRDFDIYNLRNPVDGVRLQSTLLEGTKYDPD